MAALSLTPALSVAAATGTFDGGLAVIYLENGHTTDCVESYTDLCIAAVRGDRHDNRELDARQHIRTVGLASNLSRAEAIAPVELLPDAALTYDARGVFIPIFLFALATDQVGVARGPGPTSGMGAGFEPWGIGAYAVRPGDEAPLDLEPVGYFPLAYSDEGGLTQRGFGPYYGADLGTTDKAVNDTAYVVCADTDAQECGPTGQRLERTWYGAAPNVAAGATLYEARLRQSPGELHGDSPTDRTSPSAPLAPRSLTPPPMSEGPRAEPSDHTPSEGSPRSSSGGDGASPSSPRPQPPTAPLAIAAVAAMPPELPDPAALVALSAGFAVAVLVAALYSRITRREDALRQGRRRELIDVLERAGPQSVRALALALGVDRKTAQHHARVLQRTNTVMLREVGRTTVVALPHQDVAEAELSGPSRAERALLEAILDCGGQMPRRELHARTRDMPVRTRNHAIRALIAKHRVVREWDGWTEILRLRRAEAASSA